jgi:hypothetical protein
MSVNPPQMVNVRCPACQTQYTASLHNLVDVGRSPRLKTLLLQGRLNVGVCPQCGTGGMLNVPLIYHDPEKELLFCLVPQELRMSEGERQRAIGEMSNAVINSLPTQQRRGYLLQPRVFLSMQSLLEAVLEADGITKEMLQNQQAKVRILGEMIQAADDPLRLAALINEHKDKIDDEFFVLLTANLRAAEQSTRTESIRKLTKLRETLLERTDAGKHVAEREKAISDILGNMDENLTRADLLQRIIAATASEHYEDILRVLVTVARPLVDYQFFQLLTQHIEAAEQEGDLETSQKLKSTRDTVLDLIQELDAQIRDQMQQKAQLLAEIMQSDDPAQIIRTHLDDIDEVFMSVLEANIAQNEQRQQNKALDALRAVRNTIAEILQENAPPEIRFINQLLQAEYPNETRRILAENSAMVGAELLHTMEMLANDLADRGDKETSERLNAIKAQAELQSSSL